MSGMRVSPRIFIVVLVLSLLLQNTYISNTAPVSAQESSFVMTGAIRSCEGPSASLSWTVSGTMTSVLVTQVNSGAGTSAVLDATAFARSDGWEFEYSIEGMNVVRVDVQMDDGWTYHYEADVSTCGVTATPVGGPVSGPPVVPEPANLAVSGAYLECGEAGGFGFSYSASREVLLVVYAMHLDHFQQVGDPFVGQSGNYYSQFYNEGTLSFEVAVYETTDTALANPIDGYTQDLTCVPDPPGETPTATVTPSPTVDPSAPDPTTPTPQMTEQPVLQPSPPVTPDGAEVPADVTPTPTEAPVAPPEPTPTTQTFTFVVPDPSEGFFVTPEPTPSTSPELLKMKFFGRDLGLVPEAGPGAKPGTWVRINIAEPGAEPAWWPVMVPDPRNGPLVIPAGFERIYRILWDKIYPFGNILVVQQPEKKQESKNDGFLLEIRDDDGDTGRDLNDLFYGSFILIEWLEKNYSASSVAMIARDDPEVMGLLGPGGVYQLPVLDPGLYEMTIVTPKGVRIDVRFEVGDDPDASFALQRDESGTWELVPAEVSVTALPQTGSGSLSGQKNLVYVLSVLAVGAVALGIRRSGKQGNQGNAYRC